MGGRWTLRDIVDYELIATMALLETAADRRETIMRQIYEVNRADDRGRQEEQPVGDSRAGRAAARRARSGAPGRQAAAWAASRSIAPTRAFEADGKKYGAGTFVIPMTQVFARYAKDMLEKQTYPEVRRGPNAAPEPPYDVTAWSLGMLLGVDTVFVKNPLPAIKMTRVDGAAEDRRRGDRQRHRGSRSTTRAPTPRSRSTVC